MDRCVAEFNQELGKADCSAKSKFLFLTPIHKGAVALASTVPLLEVKTCGSHGLAKIASCSCNERPRLKKQGGRCLFQNTYVLLRESACLFELTRNL